MARRSYLVTMPCAQIVCAGPKHLRRRTWKVDPVAGLDYDGEPTQETDTRVRGREMLAGRQKSVRTVARTTVARTRTGSPMLPRAVCQETAPLHQAVGFV